MKHTKQLFYLAIIITTVFLSGTVSAAVCYDSYYGYYDCGYYQPSGITFSIGVGSVGFFNNDWNDWSYRRGYHHGGGYYKHYNYGDGYYYGGHHHYRHHR